MKRTLAAAGLALLAVTGTASAASWSVIVEPGVYGRVAVGGYAQPPLVYDAEPVVAATFAADGQPAYAEPVYDDQPPVYLWVPEVHRLNWARYCDVYSACDVPVYFVQDGWYDDVVMHRRWSAEQRAWDQRQWIEQDRLARERWERARWDREQLERQRQQQQWADQRARDQARWDQGRFDREQAERERQEHARWEQAHGRDVQPVPAWQPGQRPQPGFAPWQSPRPVPVNDARPSGRGHGGDPEGERGNGHGHDHDRDDRQRNDRVDPRHQDDANVR